MEKFIPPIIIEKILENANSTIAFLLLIFFCLVYVLSRANAIYEFLDKFNNRELSKLKELLADENISESAKDKLKDKIDLIAYQKITGLPADIHLQKKIIKHYELAEGRLKYSDFKRCFAFLKINKKGYLYLRNINIFDWLDFIASFFLSFSIFLLLILLTLVFVYAQISFIGRVTCGVLIIVLIMFLTWFSARALSIFVVKKLREEINANTISLMNQESIGSSRLRPYGLNEGEFTVPDDFDDPLPEGILDGFEGK